MIAQGSVWLCHQQSDWPCPPPVQVGNTLFALVTLRPLPFDCNWEVINPSVNDWDVMEARLFDVNVPVLGAVNGGPVIQGDFGFSFGDIAVAAQDLWESQGTKDACKFAAMGGLVSGQASGEVAHYCFVCKGGLVQLWGHHKGQGSLLQIVFAGAVTDNGSCAVLQSISQERIHASSVQVIQSRSLHKSEIARAQQSWNVSVKRGKGGPQKWSTGVRAVTRGLVLIRGKVLSNSWETVAGWRGPAGRMARCCRQALCLTVQVLMWMGWNSVQSSVDEQHWCVELEASEKRQGHREKVGRVNHTLTQWCG